jgi:hypothetical protein
MDNINILSICQSLENDGLVVLLKWDGERGINTKPIVVSKPGSDFSFRMDSDDLTHLVNMALSEYKRFKSNVR